MWLALGGVVVVIALAVIGFRYARRLGAARTTIKHNEETKDAQDRMDAVPPPSGDDVDNSLSDGKF